MAKVKFEKFSKVSREKIFDIVTNYESLQTLIPEFFPSMRIISSRPNNTLVEQHLKLAQKEFVVMAKHVIERPYRHEVYFVGGDLKGSKIIEKFEQLEDKVRIEVNLDLKPKISHKFSNFFNKNQIENEFPIILDKLIKVAEI